MQYLSDYICPFATVDIDTAVLAEEVINETQKDKMQYDKLWRWFI